METRERICLIRLHDERQSTRYKIICHFYLELFDEKITATRNQVPNERIRPKKYQLPASEKRLKMEHIFAINGR